MTVDTLSPNSLAAGLRDYPNRQVFGEVIVVHTHVIYDDGQGVSVEVHPSFRGTWKVSDGKGGLNVLAEHLAEPHASAATRAAQDISDRTSVSYEKGEWFMMGNSIDQVPVAIALVANASQRWVNHIFSRRHGIDIEDLDEKIFEHAVKIFGSNHVTKLGRLLGESTREYEFPAIIMLPDKRSAAFTAASPHGSSINSAYTKLMDVKASESRPSFLGVVIGSSPKWTSADVSLLRGACDDVVEIGAALDRRLTKFSHAA